MKSYLQLHTLLLSRIKTLLSEKNFYSNEEYRRILSHVILDFFPLLKWLSEVVGSKEDLGALFTRFKKLYRVNEQEVLRDVEYSPHQIENFEDEINYLKVCVENTCNVDLDNVNFDAPKRTLEDIELSAFEKFRRYSSNSEYISDDMDEYGDDSPEIIIRLKKIINSPAWEREKLHSKIMSGEVYIYKTKPKRNLAMKILLIGLWYATFIFSILALGNNFFDREAIESVSGLHIWLLRLVTMAFTFLSAANFLHLVTNMKNDNLIYHFCGRSLSSFLSIFTIVFFLFYFLGYLFLTNGLVFYLTGALRSHWSWIFGLTISAIVLHIASCLFLQPEEDREVMERFIKEYVSDSSDSLPQDL